MAVASFPFRDGPVIYLNLLEDRNPSPPPEVLENDEDFVPDRIGKSMYSKRWLYKTLMKMLKVVEQHAAVENKSEESSSKSVEKVSEESSSKSLEKESEESSSKSENLNGSGDQNIVELDKKIEEDACTLWDMSANSEVAEFLCECNVADIFLTIIENTKSPRLLEIVVGILGNMSSFDSSCKYISDNTDLVKAVIRLTGCSDSCTLVQVFRLLNCGVANDFQKLWYIAFEEECPTIMQNVKNILENNLCPDVLQSLLQFMNRALIFQPCYSTPWTEDSYFMAIIESGKQLLKCNEDLDSFWSVLWSIDSIHYDCFCLPVYVDHFLDLKPLFEAYALKVGEEETLPQPARLDHIGQTFALFGNLLVKKAKDIASVKLENDVLKAIVHIYRIVKSFLQKHVKKRKPLELCYSSDEEIENAACSNTQTEENCYDGELLLAIISAQNTFQCIGFCATACSHSPKGAEGLQILDEIIDVNSEMTPDSVRNIGKQ